MQRAALFAAEPFDVIAGGPEQWAELERVLGLLKRDVRSAVSCGGRAGLSGGEGPFPRGGVAAGWIAYDGTFWFGLYRESQVVPAERFSAVFATEESMAGGEGGGEAAGRYQCGELRSSLSRQEYCERVERIREYIAAGDIYQVNLTRRLTAPFSGSTRALYSVLREVSPAPFAAYLETPGLTVASASPELFLRFSGGQVTTRPIKGTRPRHRDAQADARAAYELVRSEKELAELLMITDLERNDLGQVCRYGTVEVTDLIRRESYAQVHHLMSNITGWLRPGVEPVQALRACFPGGSITGAPKRRACEIIRELEPVERGLYCGAVGYFGFDGECQFNIAIRTLELRPGEVSFGVGSGITFDSVAEAEFEETEHKAGGLRAALCAPHALRVSSAVQGTTGT